MAVAGAGGGEVDEVGVGSRIGVFGDFDQVLQRGALVLVAEAVPDYEGEGAELGCGVGCAGGCGLELVGWVGGCEGEEVKKGEEW